jgi:hypothetical protein
LVKQELSKRERLERGFFFFSFEKEEKTGG